MGAFIGVRSVADTNDYYNGYQIGAPEPSGYFYCNLPTTGIVQTNVQWHLNVKYSMDFSAENFYIDNVKAVTMPTITHKSFSHPLYLFGSNFYDRSTGQPVTAWFIGRVYKCQILESNKLVKDLVPVKRLSDNMLGMFDKINQEFLPVNNKAGFIVG